MLSTKVGLRLYESRHGPSLPFIPTQVRNMRSLHELLVVLLKGTDGRIAKLSSSKVAGFQMHAVQSSEAHKIGFGTITTNLNHT